MSRWKYRSEVVTVGENSQKVRGMTHGERAEFAQASVEIKEGKRKPTDLPALIAGFGCIDPQVTPEEVAAMPSDLLDAVVTKVMALSGFKSDEKKELKKFPDVLTTQQSRELDS